MAERTGEYVVDVLEHAAERYVAPTSPDAYRCLMMHVGAAGTLRAYDGSETYWGRVQVILDFFFSAHERAEVCEDLLRCEGLCAAPGSRRFLASALAERRLQEVLAAIPMRLSSNG